MLNIDKGLDNFPMICPRCGGDGLIQKTSGGGFAPVGLPCWKCVGRGHINDVTNKYEHPGTDGTFTAGPSGSPPSTPEGQDLNTGDL